MSQPESIQPELPLLSFHWPNGPTREEACGREWLLTNGVGGYAAGTVGGFPTRRYHGLFIPSLERYGRTVMLARISEDLRVGDQHFRLDGEEHVDGSAEDSGLAHLRGFALRGLVPEWQFEVNGGKLERRQVLVHGENTAFILYQHKGGPEIRLRLRPFPMFRPHEQPVGSGIAVPVVTIEGPRIELSTSDRQHPPVRMRLYSSCPAPFVSLPNRSAPLEFHLERNRGYAHEEALDSPGYFECVLHEGETLGVGVTAGRWAMLDRDPLEALALEYAREARLLEQAPLTARTGTAGRLVLAADQFVIDPVTRPKDEAYARAIGENARSVIAGYHWFTDWGRDTMISLEGLTLSTGRTREAAAILRTFQHYVKDGLLPNLFPEGENEGLYHTADATLWFFHALDRYLTVTGDMELLRDAFPTLNGIITSHVKGTRFGIGVDPRDGLLRQGAEGYQLTWMDAKVDDWVVTPRRGKAVEINALWFNALRLMVDWAERLGQDPRGYAGHAEQAYGAFNKRFWNPKRSCLFDVIDGENGKDDPAVRPNQVFAVSLHHPVLRKDRWEPVLEKVREQLLTPVGLRSLSPDHPDFKRAYDGDLRARDAAYHQGTVWAWLIGHFIDATLRMHGDPASARTLLLGLESHLRDGCVGTVAEIFDATGPYRPRGCVAQAWSVAELLRAWLKTA